jgi:hypothetical protein
LAISTLLDEKIVKSFLAPLLIFLDQLAIFAIHSWKPEWINSNSRRWFGAVPMPTSLLLALIVITLLGTVFQLKKISPVGYMLLLAGTVSNILAYFIYGRVLDFIQLPSTYANTADLMIVIGCGIALYQSVRWVRDPLPPA